MLFYHNIRCTNAPQCYVIRMHYTFSPQARKLFSVAITENWRILTNEEIYANIKNLL